MVKHTAPKRILECINDGFLTPFKVQQIAYALAPITRQERVEASLGDIFQHYDEPLRTFLNFVLAEYVKEGVGELDQSKLPDLLELRYKTVQDAAEKLGSVATIRNAFIGFQKYLYE